MKQLKRLDLDKRICDTIPDATNTQTLREWIHDIYKYVFKDDISDEELNNMSNKELIMFIDELDWLSWK